jgi:hypothetical protein
LFSITSAQVRHPNRLDLLVGALRYHSLGRDREGMVSTYLADRVNVGDTVSVFIFVPMMGFRMPVSHSVPIDHDRGGYGRCTFPGVFAGTCVACRIRNRLAKAGCSLAIHTKRRISCIVKNGKRT